MARRTDDIAGVARDGDTLVFSGALSREVVPGLWPRALALVAGARRFSLEAVASVDSAGLALLAELAERAGADVAIVGEPKGLAELRAAYRLDPTLAFGTTLAAGTA
jgi:phospholipid transport system transporter-binding protein